MTETKLYRFLRTVIADIFSVWFKELKSVFSDAGVIIFFLVVPFGYPLLYSYMYNNEMVREVPMVVVDQNRSSMSRDFIRRIDGTPDVHVVSRCTEVSEGQELMHRRQAYGILLIPEDFSRNIARGEQSTVSLYSDMSSMLFYKAMLTASTDVSMKMGKEIQVRNLGNVTQTQGDRITTPAGYDWVPMFNPQVGFGSAMVPAILILIIQQTLLLGVGMLTGTSRNHANRTFPLEFGHHHFIGSLRIVTGKALCYFMIYAPVCAWVLRGVPSIFDFPMVGHPGQIMLFLLPYLLSAIFFAITLAGVIRDRETPMLIFVFTSVPLLFLAGVSWPQAAIPVGWKWFSYLFPSTFGIQGFLKLSTMGADLHQIRFEYIALWVQTFVFFTTACISYHFVITGNKLKRLRAMRMLKRINLIR
ncbi:ABC transporter permease [Parabacteroides sp. FAFU027]|uniref:ABC transporter permease n=1 Tax=Parabacteroides sp. FAFU027 TaxID=2922715 RepID=UPI001FAF73A3|nr:ABC transporter permease [Parabacteroides sp. FAFU027]